MSFTYIAVISYDLQNRKPNLKIFLYGSIPILDEETDAQGGKIFDKVYQENIHWSLKIS